MVNHQLHRCLQALYVAEVMLLQNACHVRLGDIILKGTVAENYRGVARGFELLVLLGNTEGQRIDFLPNNVLVKADSTLAI